MFMHTFNIQTGMVLEVFSVYGMCVLTAGFSAVTPRRHRTSPFSLMAHTGTCSKLLWARHGRMVTSIRGMGGTFCHGPIIVILHFL